MINAKNITNWLRKPEVKTAMRGCTRPLCQMAEIPYMSVNAVWRSRQARNFPEQHVDAFVKTLREQYSILYDSMLAYCKKHSD